MNKKFILILLGVFALTAAAFFYTLYQGSKVPSLQGLFGQSSIPAGAPTAPAPKTTSVKLTIQKSDKGNTLTVQWQDLPDGTLMLNILRRPVTSTSSWDWTLWKQIFISSDELAGGRTSFNIGNSLLTSYTFTVEAVGNENNGEGGNEEGGGGTPSPIIIWTSPSTEVTVATPTSTPESSPNPAAPPGPTPSPSPSPTSSNENKNQPVNSSTNPGTGTSSPPSPPHSGIPYYTPQVNIAGYGELPSSSFWVQYENQEIQINWQNLPPQATSIAVLRSPDEDGPWDTVLTQKNPVETYSIQVVDSTLGQGYYYEMNVFSGSTMLGTYGPVYLPPLKQ